MIKNFLGFLLILFFVTNCNNLGGTKVKNIIDLTAKLEAETLRKALFSTGSENPFQAFNEKKTVSYKISGNDIVFEPSIAKKVIYTFDKKGYVNAFSLKEKKILWKKNITKGDLDRAFNYGGILFSNDKLYVAYGGRDLVVLDAVTGNELIRKEFFDVIRSKPAMIDDKVVLVQTVNNQLIAYDTETSRFVWMHEGGIEIISTKNHAPPAVYDNRVLASYSSGEVVYLNARDGSELWRYNLLDYNGIEIPSFSPAVIVTKPIFDRDFIYFATSNGKLIKLNLNSVSESWVKLIEDVQSMSLHDGNLIVTTNGRQAALLSAADGKVSWVGDLISRKEKSSKRPRTAYFLTPFVVKNENIYTINILDRRGGVYQFTTDEFGTLPSQPNIFSVGKQVKNYWISCCDGKIHIISSKNVRF